MSYDDQYDDPKAYRRERWNRKRNHKKRNNQRSQEKSLQSLDQYDSFALQDEMVRIDFEDNAAEGQRIAEEEKGF